jgi:hypothetical protein
MSGGGDNNLCLLLDLWLGMEGDPQAGELEHRDVVGAISNGDHLLEAESLLLGNGLQQGHSSEFHRCESFKCG